MGFGNGLVFFRTLTKPVNCFHSQPGAALYSCYLVLVMTPGWRAADGGFCGGAVHLPGLHVSLDQGGVCSDLTSAASPCSLIQIPSREWGPF